MTADAQKNWTKDFGIDSRKPPSLFTSKEQLTPATPQAHLLRRAFELFDLDGVLCTDHSPIVYFKIVKQVSASVAYQLHQKFWNHGGAPVLVLISNAEVHIYSGMSRPEADAPVSHKDLPSFIETVRRAADLLRSFLMAVESGEYFARHAKFFNPAQRVDRDLLDSLHATREKLGKPSHASIPTSVLDALLCRLVFTCYLFDREVIDHNYLKQLGISGANHLRDVLALTPQTAKIDLYKLFRKLGQDFNGDLFSDDLSEEAEWIQDSHIRILSQFFHGTNVRTGQGAFWPYDFKCIPIETISAIYERFLKEADERLGAFYTPRFLAEIVLDIALADTPKLLGKRALDPACGSGIFLVGLFNRIAEEWKQANPKARNDTRARELARLLKESLFGIDVKETACRIAAFSLYLAYLDQLAPRDIQALQQKGRALPQLTGDDGNIRCCDFFNHNAAFPSDIDIVIGNPPWGSIASPSTPAGQWCAVHSKPLPDNQIAAAFVWKGVTHLRNSGNACFVLPHGLIFNHSTTAVKFQRAWIESNAVDCVLNLADLRYFLFEKAIHPAIVVRYRNTIPANQQHRIHYWSPKADWTVTKTQVITIAPEDRTSLSVGEILADLNGLDAPQIWKRHFWASSRDRRLLDRLSQYPRLRTHVRRAKEPTGEKPWIVAVGFQPVGINDQPNKSEEIQLPSRLFIKASNPALDLFLLTRDCSQLDADRVTVRRGSNKNTEAFRAPHVLLAKGFTSTAYVDFAVSFQDAVRGIHGPESDRELLMFLAAYLRSRIARYYLFHTTANWGIYRPEVHLEEILRVPFPFPDEHSDPKRAIDIVHEVAQIVETTSKLADADALVDRANIIRNASNRIEPLVAEYFDIRPLENLLIEDTINVSIESIQPTQAQLPVPTLKAATAMQFQKYYKRVCTLLNGWSSRSKYAVRGTAFGSDALGVGLAVFEKVDRNEVSIPIDGVSQNMLVALDVVRKAATQKNITVDLVRGVMAFSGNRIYLVKPIGQRNWTQTAALNDTDVIAATILMCSTKEGT